MIAFETQLIFFIIESIISLHDIANLPQFKNMPYQSSREKEIWWLVHKQVCKGLCFFSHPMIVKFPCMKSLVLGSKFKKAVIVMSNKAISSSSFFSMKHGFVSVKYIFNI